MTLKPTVLASPSRAGAAVAAMMPKGHVLVYFAAIFSSTISHPPRPAARTKIGGARTQETTGWEVAQSVALGREW